MATDSLNARWQTETLGRRLVEVSGPRIERDAVAFLASLLFHLALVLILGTAPVLLENETALLVELTPLEEEPLDEQLLPDDFYISERPLPEVGAQSLQASDMAFSAGEVLSDLSQIPIPVDLRPVEMARLDSNPAIEIATALHVENLPVRGAAGEGVTGAAGAIDRITQEILLSLEERPTLVVWLFDQSASLLRQRAQVHAHFDRVYEELGLLQAADNPGFQRHSSKKPLLTAVMAFGSEVTFITDQPTDDLAEIKAAVAAVPADSTGIERVFTAVHMAAERYKRYRRAPSPRNVMLVIFSDEAGEDQQGVDRCVTLCRRFEMPVYVVGVPAPFGRRETLVKWVDPDPDYDQSPQWGVVDQGPETLIPERIQLAFFGGADPDPMDSGFGPFALTRLCYESGGIYFSVHPNRNVNRRLRRNETSEFSAHLKYFFDPEVMRKYRPDYVTTQEYRRRINDSLLRTSLVRAAELSWTGQLEAPQTRFVKRSDAALAAALTEAQKAAAVLEPRLQILYDTLNQGQGDRDLEILPRWQAGYDLAVGRVLASKVRTEGYNSCLAQAKRGLTFENPANNTWVLSPFDEITAGSRMAKEAQLAAELLQRVVREHPGTPWALLAERELATPLGWKWVEDFTNLAPPAQAGPGNNNNNRGPRNDQARSIQRPPPRRPPPKL